MKTNLSRSVRVSDYLMFVGSCWYPTVDVYIEEAKRLGICKRLGHIPHNLVMGESRVFLAHDDGVADEAFVFGYFIPQTVECLLQDEDDLQESLDPDSVTLVFDWSQEEERECGFRHPGLYLISDLIEDDSLSGLRVFAEPRRLSAFDGAQHRFRGMLEIDYGEDLFKARPDQMIIPPSRIRVPTIAPTWWIASQLEELMSMVLDKGMTPTKAAQLYYYRTGRPKSNCLSKIRSVLKELSNDV